MNNKLSQLKPSLAVHFSERNKGAEEKFFGFSHIKVSVAKAAFCFEVNMYPSAKADGK